MSILKRQVHSSSDFSSFFIVITHNSSVNFWLIHFLLWTKWFHESNNFYTFRCSDENLPNSSFHFPNHELIFLQIFSFPCLFSAMIYIYICANFLDFLVLGSKFNKFFSYLKKKKESSNFPLLLSIMRHNSSVPF